jgi:hypothetical protein
MSKKPDFADQFPLIRFPLYELAADCWRGARSVGSRSPSDPSRRSAGPLSEVTLTFGVVTSGATWEEVTSTAPDADPRSREQATRDALATTLALASLLRDGAQTTEGERARLDAWARSDAAALATASLPLDGTPIEFCTASYDGFHAAVADLPTGRVTVNGMLALDEITLQTVTALDAYRGKRR